MKREANSHSIFTARAAKADESVSRVRSMYGVDATSARALKLP